ncbi:MAG: hypothetical protein R3A48_17075 [Polyangiales bacterium]
MQEISAVLADELKVADTRELKAVLQHEVAEIDERVRGDEPAAARGYLSAFNTRPAFRAPLDSLIRLYTRRKSTANLSKLYDTLVKAAPTPRDRGDAMVLRGELHEDALGDPEQARQSYEAAVAVDPNHRVAWINLERMALRAGDSAAMLRSVERLAELTRDPGRRSRLLIEIAWEQSKLGTSASIEEAARRLHEAASLPLGRWRALLELERFGEQHGRHQDVIFSLEARASLAQEVAEGGEFHGGSGAFSVSRLLSAEQASRESVELWSRAARMRFGALGDAAGAEAAMERALALRPSDPRVQFAAMALFDQMGEIESAASHAEWLLGQNFGDASARAALHFRLAESAALGGDIAAAATSLRAALALDPSSAAARGALVEQVLASGDGFEAVREFDELAEGATPGPARAAMLRAAAAFSLALRADVEGALARFRKASDEDPGDLVSRRAAVMLLARAAATAVSVEEAAALHRARVSALDALLPHASDDDERASLLIERFYALRHDLADLRGAAETAERLVAATRGARWATEAAATLWAAAGSPAAASRWAETLASRDDLDGADEASWWRAAAARFAWAAGDEARARSVAVAAHEADPSDDYLAALALPLSASARRRPGPRGRAAQGQRGRRGAPLAGAGVGAARAHGRRGAAARGARGRRGGRGRLGPPARRRPRLDEVARRRRPARAHRRRRRAPGRPHRRGRRRGARAQPAAGLCRPRPRRRGGGLDGGLRERAGRGVSRGAAAPGAAARGERGRRRGVDGRGAPAAARGAALGRPPARGRRARGRPRALVVGVDAGAGRQREGARARGAAPAHRAAGARAPRRDPARGPRRRARGAPAPGRAQRRRERRGPEGGGGGGAPRAGAARRGQGDRAVRPGGDALDARPRGAQRAPGARRRARRGHRPQGRRGGALGAPCVAAPRRALGLARGRRRRRAAARRGPPRRAP